MPRSEDAASITQKWVRILLLLGVSSTTLSRRRQELGMSVGHGSKVSQIFDAFLDDSDR